MGRRGKRTEEYPGYVTKGGVKNGEVYMDKTEENVVSVIVDLIEKHTYCNYRQEDGFLSTEIYADYRDVASDETVIQWCMADNPLDAFWETLDEWYQISVWDMEDEVIAAVRDHWDSKVHSYEANEEFVEEWIREHLSVKLPADHYFNQSVCVDIIVDTGDGNFDYVSNDMYPHYDGRYEDKIPEEASILWLARQQGYKKRQLNKAMRKAIYDDSKLLKSLRKEVLNCSSHMNALTFFVEMSLKELLELQEMLKENDKNDIEGGARQTLQIRKGQHKLILSKDSVCGLYDAWSGAGSILEIELEQDVELPLKYVSTALPDGARGYGAARVYGICRSFWEPTIKQIA